MMGAPESYEKNQKSYRARTRESAARRWYISDHRPNEGTQRLVAQAIGGELPEVIHHGLLVGDDGKKLSKRHGAGAVADLREGGIPPTALRAYLDAQGLPAVALRFAPGPLLRGGVSGKLRRVVAAVPH